MKILKDRYHWLDVFKAFSIFFVIYYHLISNDFTAYINAFLVQLFFFASGATASSGEKLSVKNYVTKRFCQIMIPYFAFGVISMAVRLFSGDMSVSVMVRQLLTGRRNDIFVVTLWFLPCLFVMGIFYKLIMCVVPDGLSRLIVATGISFVFRLFSEGNMLPWGVDNAIRFLVYYAMGNVFSAHINRMDWNRFSAKGKLRFVAISVFSLLFTVFHYRRGLTWMIDLVGLPHIYLLLFMSLFVCAANAILLYVLASVLLKDIKPLQFIGKTTLTVCCLQAVSDKLLYMILAAMNISFVADTSIKAAVLAVVLISMSSFAHVVLKKYLPILYGQFKKA